MKSSRQLLSTLAVGTVALVGFKLANTEFAARLPLDTIIAVIVSLGLIQFALTDYLRRRKPLNVRSVVLRPDTVRPVGRSVATERTAA